MQHLLSTASSQRWTARRKRPGVTLVELLVFIAVFAIVAFTVLPLLFSATENRIRQQSISLVEQNGAQVLQSIGYRLQYAERIQDPPPQQEGPVLTLQTGCGATNPTIIGVQTGTVAIIRNRIKQIVTSPEVTVEDFRIQNTSASATQQSFRVSFRVDRTILLRDPQVYTRTFEGLFTLTPSELSLGSACGGVSCASPTCDGGTYAWEVCESMACQEVSLPLDCGGYCCSPGGCAAHTSAECAVLGGTFHATQAACDAACGAPGSVCGNNIVEPGEECDEGDTVNGDGCSSTCQLEGQSSSVGSCGACPPSEACNPSGFCQRTCTCDADCGLPTACYLFVSRMRQYPTCEGGFCTGWESAYGCGGEDCQGNPALCAPTKTCVTEGAVSYCACDSDADCPAGQNCILDETELPQNRFCNFLGWNIGASCDAPPSGQYSCQWEARTPPNGPYYINDNVTLNLSCWKDSGGVPVEANILTAVINGVAADTISGNDASRAVASASAGTITYTANVTPVGGPPITITTTVTYTDDTLPDWCQCNITDVTPAVGTFCAGDTFSANYQCFDGFGPAVPHAFEVSDTINVSGNDPYLVQDGEVRAYVTPPGAGTYSYVLNVNGMNMRAEDGSPLSCGVTTLACKHCCDDPTDTCTGRIACLGGETEHATHDACVVACTPVPPAFTCACTGVTEATPQPPTNKVCTNEQIIASFNCTETLSGNVQIEGGAATVNGTAASRKFLAGATPGTQTYELTVDGVEKGLCSQQVYDCGFCPDVTQTCLLEASVGGTVLTGPVAPGAQVTLTMTCKALDLSLLHIQRAMFYVDGGTLLGEGTIDPGGWAIFQYVTSATATQRTYTGVGEIQEGGCGSAETTVAYTGSSWCDTHPGEWRWTADALGYPPTGTWPRQNPPRDTDCQYECVDGLTFCMENPGAGYIGCGGPGSFPEKCAVRGQTIICSACMVAPP